jgi:GTPase SAR1 family protein
MSGKFPGNVSIQNYSAHLTFHTSILKSLIDDCIYLYIRGRGNVYIVGEGRAGKTCVANSLMGIPYRETESTVGISRYQCESAASHTESDMTFDCDVKTAAVISDSSQYEHAEWTRYEVPERLLETVIAAQVQQTEKIKINAGNKEQISVSVNVPQTRQSTIQGGGTIFKISSTTAASANANPSPAKARVAEEIKTFDEEIVAKCLSSNVSLGSDLIISMYDFGGQSVFNAIHHLFLHRGIYLVCFNMEDMISSDEAVVEQCLTLIEFWLNSIYIHTYDKETRESSSAILIGTRKDKVADIGDHSVISRLLSERFNQYQIVVNDSGETSRGRNTLFFSPLTIRRERLSIAPFPEL